MCDVGHATGFWLGKTSRHPLREDMVAALLNFARVYFQKIRLVLDLMYTDMSFVHGCLLQYDAVITSLVIILYHI